MFGQGDVATQQMECQKTPKQHYRDRISPTIQLKRKLQHYLSVIRYAIHRTIAMTIKPQNEIIEMQKDISLFQYRKNILFMTVNFEIN